MKKLITKSYIESLTKEEALQKRKDWDKITAEIKNNSEKNIKHRCGALVSPEYISCSRDVCIFCDLIYQPCLANPIFRIYFEELVPEMVPILFD